jgi:small subunit ribosomal protein S2
MVDFKELLKAGVHFGHKTSFGNPKMRPYIWGAKNRIHLIDVSKTATLLDIAGNKLKDLASNGGAILWVGTKKPAQMVIEKVGKELDMPFVVNRWIGGTLSNYAQVKKAITRYLFLRDDILKKSDTLYTKKELVMLQKQLNRLEKNVGGIVNLEFPPAAIVVVDAQKEYSAVKEAFGMKIPVIGLVDTNTDPSFINCVIPCNDDSPRSVKLIIETLAAKVAEGKKLGIENRKTREAELKEKAKEKKDKLESPILPELFSEEGDEESDNKPKKMMIKKPVRRTDGGR